MMNAGNGFMSPRYDFQHQTPVRKSYVIASSYRSGSTYLCHHLWNTGLMGAPWEYFNYEIGMRSMAMRLRASAPADYVRKLVGCRTSRNGVFGVKAHIHHFTAALDRFPGMLDALPGIRFVYINRSDRVAQAVSMAKAIQTRAWTSLAPMSDTPLFYSAEFIEACLRQVEKQIAGWEEWFAAHGVDPLVVEYERLLAEPNKIVAQIVRHVGADGVPDAVALPDVQRQSDGVNAEWIRRFLADRGGSLDAQPAPLPLAG